MRGKCFYRTDLYKKQCKYQPWRRQYICYTGRFAYAVYPALRADNAIL